MFRREIHSIRSLRRWPPQTTRASPPRSWTLGAMPDFRPFDGCLSCGFLPPPDRRPATLPRRWRRSRVAWGNGPASTSSGRLRHRWREFGGDTGFRFSSRHRTQGRGLSRKCSGASWHIGRRSRDGAFASTRTLIRSRCCEREGRSLGPPGDRAGAMPAERRRRRPTKIHHQIDPHGGQVASHRQESNRSTKSQMPPFHGIACERIRFEISTNLAPRPWISGRGTRLGPLVDGGSGPVAVLEIPGKSAYGRRPSRREGVEQGGSLGPR